ncbi:MAG TPA: hypothetical protein GXX21_02515 [Syntrophomonadaceae bacterium]|nr:hypothetical protein [Syntrophomonadaceae bacterium]
MHKAREIIGLPVVSLDTGEEIGVVTDLLWSHPQKKIICLVVEEKSGFNHKHQLPFTNINSIGKDAVTVSSAEVMEEEREHLDAASLNQKEGELVLTQDGENLGTLNDVIFDVNDGKLLGYELSTGLVGDLLTGRMVMSPEMVATWGKEAIIAGCTGANRGDQGAVSDMQW